ncbi:Tropomodulin-2, partial [Cladochytrium tenue]
MEGWCYLQSKNANNYKTHLIARTREVQSPAFGEFRGMLTIAEKILADVRITIVLVMADDEHQLNGSVANTTASEPTDAPSQSEPTTDSGDQSTIVATVDTDVDPERAENERIAAIIEATRRAQTEREAAAAAGAPPSPASPPFSKRELPYLASLATSVGGGAGNRHSMFAFSASSRAGSFSQARGGLSSASSAASLLPAPAARSSAGGPVVPISAVVGAVRATNPILDELLHAIRLLNDDDPELVVLDLKDCRVLSPIHGAAIAEGLAKNTHLKELVLENTKLQTASAVDLANALRFNDTLEILNLESNLIAPAGMKALAESLEHNRGLRELKLANQKSLTGTDAEQAFAKGLSKNTTLIRLGLRFRDVASRNSVDRAITRNKEIARKARLAAAAV